MQVMEQNEEYEEDEFEEDVESEAEEDTESRISTIYGIPVKYAVIGGVVIIILILAAVLFATRKKSAASDSQDDLSAMLSEYDTPVVDDTPVQSDTSVDSPSADTGATSGETVFNPETGLFEPVDAPASDTSVTPETATSEERLKLRAMGYSGDEIDLALSEGFSVEALIEEAQALYDEEADKALRRMSDSASEEFRYIIDNTYFGQTGYEFVSLKDEAFGTYDYYQGSYTVNADYVKCPTYGSQLQLKCRVAQDLCVFYVVTPDRFAQLPQEGNIVLRVNYTTYGVNTYVTSVTETDPTLDTIDSSDITADEIDGKTEPVADTDEQGETASTEENPADVSE